MCERIKSICMFNSSLLPSIYFQETCGMKIKPVNGNHRVKPAIRSLTLQRLLVPDLLRCPRLVLSGCRDTEFCPAREPAAVEHFRPRESERTHHGHAAVSHRLTQAPAGADRPAELGQTHRGEQRAQELLGVPVTQLGDEGQPGRRLLLGLPQCVMAKQVGDPHLPVADAVAQGQGAGKGFAHRADRGSEHERRRPELDGSCGVGSATNSQQQNKVKDVNRHRCFRSVRAHSEVQRAAALVLRPDEPVNKEVWWKRGVNERAGASQSTSHPVRLVSASAFHSTGGGLLQEHTKFQLKQ